MVLGWHLPGVTCNKPQKNYRKLQVGLQSIPHSDSITIKWAEWSMDHWTLAVSLRVEGMSQGRVRGGNVTCKSIFVVFFKYKFILHISSYSRVFGRYSTWLFVILPVCLACLDFSYIALEQKGKCRLCIRPWPTSICILLF